MSSTQKSVFWQQHIRAWQNSGVTQTAYCRTHGLSLANFGYWRKRFADAPHPIPAMIPVIRESLAAGIHLRSPGGWVMTVPTALNAESLRTLLAALP